MLDPLKSRLPATLNIGLVDVPPYSFNHYHEFTLARDIMFVNQIPFSMTISRNICFGTATMIQDKHTKTLLAAIK
jgi:hypothetical protein